MKVRVGVACLIVLFAAGSLCSCGGGGGGGVALSPPAFTNLAGTRWNQTDTVSALNSCGVGSGVTDPFVLHILAQSGNTISVYDERSGAGAAVNATISGYAVTYSGDRFPIAPCSDMSVSYSVTINGTGTSYSGSGTITCLDAPACTVPINITGTKI
jgi:hypothetical protein